MDGAPDKGDVTYKISCIYVIYNSCSFVIYSVNFTKKVASPAMMTS